ncbi:MAG TPA: cytochrome c [Croceibacterium sp.]
MRASGMAQAGWIGGTGLALALSACAPQQDVASTAADGHTAHQAATDTRPLPAGGLLPSGASTGGMAEQYARPHPGSVSAAGASTWVRPAPPPAFVISTPLPPAEPPAPPPAAVANRQPAPAAPAAGPVRATAPAPAPAPAPPAPAASVDLAKGRQLFTQYGCGGCHALADGGGSGGIGPSLDTNSRLSHDYVVGAVSEGRGSMPAFRDQMSAGEIATLATYIVQVARK